jgi:hypothetical protein
MEVPSRPPEENDEFLRPLLVGWVTAEDLAAAGQVFVDEHVFLAAEEGYEGAATLRAVHAFFFGNLSEFAQEVAELDGIAHRNRPPIQRSWSW